MGLVDPDQYRSSHTGFKKWCKGLRTNCAKWVHLVGAHRQPGQPVDCFDCADQWASVLTIEVAKGTRRFLLGQSEPMGRKRRELVANRRFRLMHPTPRKSRPQNSTTWLKIEPNDYLPHPPTLMKW